MSDLAARFEPILSEIVQHSTVAERFVDRNAYRLSVATMWANAVLDPSAVGLEEANLEELHDLLNDHIATTLGADESLTACFSFINSKKGEAAMAEVRLSKNHKDLLLYFASMILDPDGHRQWMDKVRDQVPTPRRY